MPVFSRFCFSPFVCLPQVALLALAVELTVLTVRAMSWCQMPASR